MTKRSFVAGFIPTRPGSGRDGTLPLQKAAGGYKTLSYEKLLGDLLQFIHQFFPANRWRKWFLNEFQTLFGPVILFSQKLLFQKSAKIATTN